MKTPATDRTSLLLAGGAFVLVVFAWWRGWRGVAVATAWSSAGALSVAVLLAAAILLRAAADRAALRAEIARLSQRLGELSQVQGRFVDNLAHELRTPLTIVLNQAEVLQRCTGNAAAMRIHAKTLADYVLHVSALFEGFLRLGSQFAPVDTSHHVALDFNDLVMAAVRRSQALASGMGVTVVATIAEADGDDRPFEVLGNEALLEAMIESLVRNAVRGSPRGKQVEVEVRSRGDQVVLQVRDHGTGIAPSSPESVFDWFFEAPNALQRPPMHGGGGAIGKRIVEHHGGTISLQNLPLGGREFEVALPRWRGEVRPSADGEPPVRSMLSPDRPESGGVAASAERR